MSQRVPYDRQQKVLAFVEKGMGLGGAARAARISPKTVEGWRRRNTGGFADRLATVRTLRDSGTRERAEVPDFITFRRDYLGRDTFTHQLEWLDLLDSGDPNLKNFRLILQPPGHGKTQFAIDYTVWRICKDPSVKVVWVSKSQPVAKKRLHEVKRLLTDPNFATQQKLKNLILDFGPFRARGREHDLPWGAEKIYVLGADVDKDPTVEALGIGNQIYGAHVDLIVLDDVADTNNQRSPTMRENQYEWFERDVASRLNRGATVLAVGTRVHEEDIYSMLMESFFPEDSRLIQAAVQDEANGKVLCPELVSFEELMQQKGKMSPRGWALIYQQATSGLPDAIFVLDDLEKAKDKLLFLGDKRAGYVIMGIDPATVGPAAAVVVSLDLQSGMRHIIDCDVRANLGTQQKIHEWVLELAERYGAREAWMEWNSQQQGYWNDDSFQKAMRAMGCRPVASREETYTGLNKYSEDVGVFWLAGQFAAGNYRIAWAGHAPRVMQPLIAELQMWTPEARITQDRVMALHMAERGCKQRMTAPQLPPQRPRGPAWLRKRRQQVPQFLRQRAV